MTTVPEIRDHIVDHIDRLLVEAEFLRDLRAGRPGELAAQLSKVESRVDAIRRRLVDLQEQLDEQESFETTRRRRLRDERRG